MNLFLFCKQKIVFLFSFELKNNKQKNYINKWEVYASPQFLQIRFFKTFFFVFLSNVVLFFNTMDVAILFVLTATLRLS